MYRRIALLLITGLILSACLPAVFVRKAVDDTTIAQQARQNQAPRWQFNLGVSVIENLRILDKDRLLVLLKNDDEFLSNGDILLLNRNNGSRIWQYPRNQQPGDYQLTLTTDRDFIFRIDSQGKSRLLAIDIQSGREHWTKEFAASMQLLPLPASDTLLILDHVDQSSNLYAINPFDGQLKWHNRYPRKNTAPAPVVSADAVWVFFNGVEKLNGANGKRLWHKQNIALNGDSPPPQLSGKFLYLVATNNHLYGLSLASGKTYIDGIVPTTIRINNIYPLNKRVYLRGIVRSQPAENLSTEERIRRAVQKSVAQSMGLSGADGNTHKLLALSMKTGKTLWQSETNEPSVSNIIDNGKILYHATASRLIALDRTNGKNRFTRMVTNAGRDYPVHIRLLDNNVIYLGEWIVAAYDQRTGKQRYVAGMNPVPDSRATMAGLDDTVGQLRQEMGQNPQAQQSIASSISKDAQRFQNLANHYNAQASQYRSLSRSSTGVTAESYYWKSHQLQNQAQIESAFSSAYSSIATTVAIWEFNEAMENAFHQSNLKSAIADATLFRKAILGGFTRFENRDYYYRPHDNLDGFVGVSIVNLHTGQRRDIMMSPAYQDYGLWNVIDLQQGIVYHHGIGLDTSAHHFVEQPRGLNKFMVYQSYLIAQPFELPGK